jgi:hypothetical protein
MAQPWKPRRAAQTDAENDKQNNVAPAAGIRGPGVSGRDPDPVDNSVDKSMLRFDPEQVLAGIVFHVIDESLARGVCPESVKQAVARLRQRGQRPAIRRSAWLAMTHHDRLEWLLAETRMIPLVGEDDLVILNGREN